RGISPQALVPPDAVVAPVPRTSCAKLCNRRLKPCDRMCNPPIRTLKEPSLMRQLRLFPATTVAAILAALVVGAAVVGNIDIVPLSLKVIERIAPGELDEIALGILLIGAGLASDLATQRAHHRAEVEARRQRVFRATIRTVQDIVNNFLTQLKLVQFTAGQD